MSLRKSDIAQAAAEADGATFTTGECVFVRTITFNSIGRITRISSVGLNHFLHLAEASMIPDTVRWKNCIEDGQIKECEPVTSEVRINLSAVVDIWAWNHPLPRTQKG